MPQISLQGQTFSYIIRRKNIRSLSLRLVSRHQLSVSANHLVPQFFITQFLQSHAEWITANSKKFSPKKSLVSLNSLEILGQAYQLNIKKSARDSVVIFEEEQKIYANTIHLTSPHLRKLFDKKFRPLALKLIRQELSALSDKYGFHYGHVTVRNTTSRFGSCSSRNNLNFNWQIIFLPPDIFRHILLHELTHTIHHNHSYKFWLELSKADPDFVAHRHYLRTTAPAKFIL